MPSPSNKRKHSGSPPGNNKKHTRSSRTADKSLSQSSATSSSDTMADGKDIAKELSLSDILNAIEESKQSFKREIRDMRQSFEQRLSNTESRLREEIEKKTKDITDNTDLEISRIHNAVEALEKRMITMEKNKPVSEENTEGESVTPKQPQPPKQQKIILKNIQAPEEESEDTLKENVKNIIRAIDQDPEIVQASLWR